MPAGNYTIKHSYIAGEEISSDNYNADHQHHIDNQNPTATDDYSDGVPQMRTVTDTGDVNTESLASSLAGELERLRYVVKHLKDTINGAAVTQWYSKSYAVSVPNASITSAKIANSATHIQSIRVGVEATTFTTTETTLASIGITMTRARLKVSASWFAMLASSASGSFTVRLKRGATVLVTQTVAVLGAVTAFEPGYYSRCVFFIDNPGPGTYTYTVTAQKASDAYGNPIADAEVLVEEIA